MSPLASTSFATFLHRIVAAGCAALVLALTIFAASPAAHNWLHADDGAAQRDEGCAVELFAAGVAPLAGPVQVAAPAAAPADVSSVPAIEFFLVSPRYLRQPERGPPVSRVS